MRTPALFLMAAALGLHALVAAPRALEVATSPDEQNWTALKITPGMISTEGKIILPLTGVRLTILPPSPPPAGMVMIPGGAFLMGSSPDPENGDQFIHTVTVSTFNIDTREVSKTLWDDVTTWGLANGYTDLPAGAGKAATHPVQTISWYAAVKWCNARSEKEGRTPAYKLGTAVYRLGENSAVTSDWAANGYRLPTEAEWEFAARGALVGNTFPNGNTLNQTLANVVVAGSPHPTYAVNGTPYTSPTGSFAANGYGLYDMAGNVSEWVWDRYGGTYYTTPEALGPDPVGPGTGTSRIYRGGNWNSTTTPARVYVRISDAPNSAAPVIGFRTVCR